MEQLFLQCVVMLVERHDVAAHRVVRNEVAVVRHSLRATHARACLVYLRARSLGVPPMAGLPTGTVTFLATDLASSTQLWEAHPGPMKGASARHSVILCDAVRASQGHVVKMTGDGVLAVFASALDAVDAAVAAQRAVCVEAWASVGPLRIRMALHTGEADQREGDYFGTTLNRTARLMSIGHGGQVLVSGATADVVVDHLPSEVSLKALGVHRLRDLDRPEHVQQLCHPDLRSNFPPLRSPESLPNNLPIQVTSLVGREAELAQTAALLASGRSLTLTGPGGSGKTRLALQLAGDARDRFADGVWLVELSELSDDELVADAAGRAVGADELPYEERRDTVAAYLAEREVLLVLDNCEHLIDACSDLVGELLRRCPGLKVLATSREPLGAEGEVTYRVPPLSLPTTEDDLDAEAVRLFAERAAFVRPDFQLTRGNSAAVVAICRRLDGLPLAIELAAACCGLMTPDEIAAQLADHFRLLVGGRRSALPRQRTLEASVEWSYELLDDTQRKLMRGLSVFAGGFSMEAAEAVGVEDASDPWATVEALSSLVDKSLVLSEPSDGETRYRMLETVRHYARSRLVEAQEADVVRDRHLAYYVALTRRISSTLSGPEMRDALAVLERELDNLRVALDWSVEPAHAHSGLRLVAASLPFWNSQHRSEGLRRARSILDVPAVPPVPARLRVRGLVGVAWMAWAVGELPTFREYAGEALAIARATHDEFLLAHALPTAGWAAMWNQVDTATALLKEAVPLLQAPGDEWYLANALGGLGAVAAHSGDTARARGFCEEAVAVARRWGNPMSLGETLEQLGSAVMFNGDFDEAEAFLDEADVLLTAIGHHAAAAVSVYRAWIRSARGEYETALRLTDDVLGSVSRKDAALSIPWSLYVRSWTEQRAGLPGAEVPSLDEAEAALARTQMQWGLVWCQAVRAEIALERGDPEAARDMARTALVLSESPFAGWLRDRALLAHARVLRRIDELERAEDEAYRSVTFAQMGGHRPATAEAFELMAGLAAQQEGPLEAARLFGAADALRERLGYPRPPVEQPAHAADWDLVTTALDPDALETASAEGRAMTLDAAVAYASRGRGERKRPSSGWASLTPTEREVVGLVAEGLRNADIAGRLFVSPSTVKTHLSHVFSKLGVTTRAELAALATRRR
jgi:predicted ATPase/class 3 adenylate cyclase/DNA-binding CsgD family transcriptional regulator